MRISIFLLFLFAAACSDVDKVPREVLGPEKMKVIIFDLLRADELVNTHTGDTLYKRDKEAEKNYEQIFLIHEVNKKQFYESYKYYQAHPNINKALFDSLIAYGNRKRNIKQLNKPSVK